MRFLFAAFILAALPLSASAAPKSKSPSKPDAFAKAHEQVKFTLKDPDSARFRSEFLGKDGAVCGFVNSKNSYGGYSGFQRYIVTSEQIVIDSDERQSWKVDSKWYDYCADNEPR